MFDPAIYAWKDRYPTCTSDESDQHQRRRHERTRLLLRGAPRRRPSGGVPMALRLCRNEHELGPGRCGSLQLDFDGTVSDVYFRDVDHHSGSVWANRATGRSRRPPRACAGMRRRPMRRTRTATRCAGARCTTSASQRARPRKRASAKRHWGLYAPGVASSRSTDVIVPESNANQAPVVNDRS